MGGDVYRLTDKRRSKIVVYYILADAFGWTKDEVDSHPFGHLKDMLFMLKEDRDREEREMMKQSRKKSF